MNHLDWLDEHLHLHTENRTSMEQLVISQEGFFDKARDFFRRNTGQSVKGADYKPVRLEHTYNFKSSITAISRQYGDRVWLNRQNWVTSPINADDIAPYLGTVTPTELVKVFTQASEFTLGVHQDWLLAVTQYFDKLKPVAAALQSGLTDENLKRALQLLNPLPEATHYFKNPPRVFPVGERKIPDSFSKIKPPALQAVKLKPLSKPEVETAVAQMVKQLEAMVLAGDAIFQAGYTVVGEVTNRELIQLARSKDPKVPKGSKRPLREWQELAQRLDVPHTYWSCDEFAITRRYYGDVVLAASRWIDRSIR